MIFFLNLFVAAILIVLGFGLKAILATWGYAVYMAFCCGWLAASVIWQLAHKSRYGHWFDPPVIKRGCDRNTYASRQW